MLRFEWKEESLYLQLSQLLLPPESASAPPELAGGRVLDVDLLQSHFEKRVSGHNLLC